MACRTVLSADILEVFATLLYPWHICMLKGVLFLLFTISKAHIRVYNRVSSAVFISRSGVSSPQHCSYLGLYIYSLGELYHGLLNCPRSRYPTRLCNIVIPAAYLYAEGCIVFTCLFVSEAYIRAYNNVSSAVFLVHLEYCLLSNALI